MENFGLLNDDIYFDVLSRLPTKDLLQLKCVCKRWCLLISNPVFRRVQSQKREPISGFFFPQKYNLYSDDIQNIAYIPVELGDGGLHQSVFNFLPEDVLVLASCLNGTRPDAKANIGLAFDPCRNTADSWTNFKLVSVQQFENGSEDPYFSFNIYSSDTDSWRTSQEVCHHRGCIFWNEVIFVEGILHWLTHFGEILAFNVENEKSCVISVPVPEPAAQSGMLFASCIGESNNKLHYVIVSGDGLHIWSLEDYLNFKWNLKCSRSLQVILEQHPSLPCQSYFSWPMDALAFKDGYLLMKGRSDIYLYNVETNKMDEVLSVSELHKYTFSPLSSALPYSLSLVPLK
ncbi:F-box protein [Melia azedarach]|uniref:F-box protein n=1 Tax=Melia azedarach TaxID=155640 RepID=A0ACC1XQR0_MELAZ|nr:F-box protein [Melia azedarach]